MSRFGHNIVFFVELGFELKLDLAKVAVLPHCGYGCGWLFANSSRATQSCD